MSIILAVETSSELCSVALYCDGEVFDVTELAPREHTRKLLPMIDGVLSNNNVSLSDLDAIAFGRGPGSFTGVRIALGVVQGLAYGADLPLIPISALHTIASLAVAQLPCREGDYLLVANDARMSELYWCLYQYQEGGVVAVTEEFVAPVEQFKAHSAVQGLPDNRWWALGSGWQMTGMETLIGALEPCNINATAPGMIPLALEKLASGETVSADEAQPVYLRDSVAWKKRQRIRSQ